MQYFPEISPEERDRLLREFENLPKTIHGQTTLSRHNDVNPDWIISILENPYDLWLERDSEGEEITIIVGRVPECRQWIKLVFLGQMGARELHSAYQDRRLARRFGGRPW